MAGLVVVVVVAAAGLDATAGASAAGLIAVTGALADGVWASATEAIANRLVIDKLMGLMVARIVLSDAGGVKPRVAGKRTLSTSLAELVDVAPVALLRSQVRDVFRRGFLAEATVLFDDRMNRSVNIWRHALGVAANIKVGAVVEP